MVASIRRRLDDTGHYLLDTGHFALEEDGDGTDDLIDLFMMKKVFSEKPAAATTRAA